MKVALVHDYIKEYGGAERVLEVLHDMFPDAPVYTSVYLPKYLGPHRERFADWDIRTSWAQNIPFKAKLISPLRLISPWLFESFDLSGYDIVIVSATGAYFPNAIRIAKGKAQRAKSKDSLPFALRSTPTHICYCHTPPRYLYGYATAREWKKNKVMNVVGVIANHFLRLVDFRIAQNVDQYIANSDEVKRRIGKFYRKDAVVVYPPVMAAKSIEHRSKSTGEYYVAGGRLARPKHIDLIVKACMELGVPLKVFGKAFVGYGEELEELTKNKKLRTKKSHYSSSEERSDESRSKSASSSHLHSNNIELLGEVTDEEKWELLAGARAFLFAAEDEDFGILPVEAMAAGIPVIAYRSGGVQETVVEEKTGLFFDELTVTSLKKAIKEFEKKKFDTQIIQQRAEEFSEEAFKKKIQELVKAQSAK